MGNETLPDEINLVKARKNNVIHREVSIMENFGAIEDSHSKDCEIIVTANNDKSRIETTKERIPKPLSQKSIHIIKSSRSSQKNKNASVLKNFSREPNNFDLINVNKGENEPILCETNRIYNISGSRKEIKQSLSNDHKDLISNNKNKILQRKNISRESSNSSKQSNKKNNKPKKETNKKRLSTSILRDTEEQNVPTMP